MRGLGVVRDCGLPDAWIGAGAIRDLVWGERYGDGFDPSSVRDVDVVFLDAADLSRDNDDRATRRLVSAWAGSAVGGEEPGRRAHLVPGQVRRRPGGRVAHHR
ncbi:nucleotidyltransferase family protein [Micromonospora sp. CPCC 206171]|uniref:nucleotidyltransferase family protein n=1 Tax=Micromonospora sp. CPCC 206171 TaxID=3122405 RepID=UPI002FF11A14